MLQTLRQNFFKYKSHHPRSYSLRTILLTVQGRRDVTKIINLHSDQLTKQRKFFFHKIQLSEMHHIVKLTDKAYSPLDIAKDEASIKMLSDANKLYRLYIQVLFAETKGLMCAIQYQVNT